MSAWLRAAHSLGSGAVSQRLLHEPWMFSVAYTTPFTVQRRFSTQPTLLLLWSRQSGSVCTSCWIGSCPSEEIVLKNNCRSWSSRSREENPPLLVRSQSVQSLSPGVKIAADCSELKYPSACT